MGAVLHCYVNGYQRPFDDSSGSRRLIRFRIGRSQKGRDGAQIRNACVPPGPMPGETETTRKHTGMSSTETLRRGNRQADVIPFPACRDRCQDGLMNQRRRSDNPFDSSSSSKRCRFRPVSCWFRGSEPLHQRTLSPASSVILVRINLVRERASTLLGALQWACHRMAGHPGRATIRRSPQGSAVTDPDRQHVSATCGSSRDLGRRCSRNYLFRIHRATVRSPTPIGAKSTFPSRLPTPISILEPGGVPRTVVANAPDVLGLAFGGEP